MSFKRQLFFLETEKRGLVLGPGYVSIPAPTPKPACSSLKAFAPQAISLTSRARG